MTDNTKNDIKNKFYLFFQDEFEDPNEEFQDFLFGLIPIDILQEFMFKKNNERSDENKNDD